MPNFNSCDVDI